LSGTDRASSQRPQANLRSQFVTRGKDEPMRKPPEIGTLRELFVDDYLVARMRGVRRVLHTPVKREVVFTADQPFEDATTAYYNLFRDGDRIRMYYRGRMPGDDLSEQQAANIAESADGIRFERPVLGLYEVNGSRENNVVWVGIESHNLFVFKDSNPACKAPERYKAVGGSWQKLYGLVSPDGIRWRRIQQEPLEVSGAFDSLNVAFWDSRMGCYRLFSRYFEAASDGTHVRAIQSAASDDFIGWSKPVPHQYPPGVPLEHFYTNATIPCPGAEHILLSFPKRFVPGRTKNTDGMLYPGEGISDCVFMSSRDGVYWERSFLEAWVRPGPDERNWTHRSNMPACGIVETGPTEWSMYISEHYGWESNRLRRLTIRPWGFVSARAGFSGGELLTRPLLLAGKELRLNYSTSAVGSVQVEILDASGKPAEGFTLSDMRPLFGDELDAPVAWKGGGDLSAFIGRSVRLRFVLKDADLFSIRTI